MRIFVPSFFDASEVLTETLSRAGSSIELTKNICQEHADGWAEMSGIEPENLVWKLAYDPSVGKDRWKADCGDTEFYIDELELI